MITIRMWLCIFVCSSLLIGCATIPKESVELSSELTKLIRSAEASHLALLDEYINVRRVRVDDFLAKEWIPKFMKNAMTTTKIRKLVDAEKDSVKRDQLLREFNEDAAVEIATQRAKMMEAVDDIGSALREAVRNHYRDMLTVNGALTAHLSSAAAVIDTRNQLLSDLKIDPKTLIPVDDINGLLENILSHQDDAGKVLESVGKVKQLLKGK